MTKYIALAYKDRLDGKFSLSLVDFPISIEGVSNLEHAKGSLQESLKLYIEFDNSFGIDVPVPTSVDILHDAVSRDNEFHSFVEIEV